MKQQAIHFFSEGCKLEGLLRLPDNIHEPLPGIVQGPGWLGLHDSKLYERYHRSFTEAGYAVLIFDYRVFGNSEGERGLIFPTRQAEEWLRRMRREHEWIAFCKRLDADRQKRVLEGQGELVNPHEELMVATPERAQAGVKKDVDSRIPDRVPLRSAEAIMEFVPENYVSAISPRAALFIATEGDAVTPEDQMLRLYEKAKPPKKLILQKETSHYAAYNQYFDKVTPQIIEWYDRYLKYDAVEVREKR